MSRRIVVASVAIVFVVVISRVSVSVEAQDRSSKAPPAAVVGRFEFEVVESFDARYSGDTPGHIGRHGELQEVRPMVALGDAVYRGDTIVGNVTRLEWSRVHGSLEVEFGPVKDARVCVGEVVWLKFGNRN